MDFLSQEMANPRVNAECPTWFLIDYGVDIQIIHPAMGWHGVWMMLDFTAKHWRHLGDHWRQQWRPLGTTRSVERFICWRHKVAIEVH